MSWFIFKLGLFSIIMFTVYSLLYIVFYVLMKAHEKYVSDNALVAILMGWSILATIQLFSPILYCIAILLY